MVTPRHPPSLQSLHSTFPSQTLACREFSLDCITDSSALSLFYSRIESPTATVHQRWSVPSSAPYTGSASASAPASASLAASVSSSNLDAMDMDTTGGGSNLNMVPVMVSDDMDVGPGVVTGDGSGGSTMAVMPFGPPPDAMLPHPPAAAGSTGPPGAPLGAASLPVSLNLTSAPSLDLGSGILDSLAGIWVAPYGSHGLEVLHLDYVSQSHACIDYADSTAAAFLAARAAYDADAVDTGRKSGSSSSGGNWPSAVQPQGCSIKAPRLQGLKIIGDANVPASKFRSV